MAKNKETLEKVATFFENRGAKEWAKAKNDEGGHHYNNAKMSYGTAEKARNSADNAKSKK